MGIWFNAYLLSGGVGKSIEDQIRDCARHYLAKHGQAPNLCRIHHTLISEPITVDGIRVEPATDLLSFDCWLGCYSEPQATQPQLF